MDSCEGLEGTFYNDFRSVNPSYTKISKSVSKQANINIGPQPRSLDIACLALAKRFPVLIKFTNVNNNIFKKGTEIHTSHQVGFVVTLSVTFISYSREHTFVICYFVLSCFRVAALHFVTPVHRMLSHLDYQNKVTVEIEYLSPSPPPNAIVS